MQQDINLYSYFQAPPAVSSIISFKRTLYTLLIIFGIFILMYLYGLWHVNHLTALRDSYHKQARDLEYKFYSFKNSFPEVFFSQDVQKSLGQLEQALSNEQKIYNEVQSRSLFSVNLIALGNAIVPNVWLTQIDIHKGGAEVILRGESLDHASIQTFVNHLTNEKIYQRYQLNIQNIEKEKPDKQQLSNLVFEIILVKKL